MFKCILLTDDFPYGKWETFLEYESSYLSKRIDKIFVVPFCKKNENVRSLPNNFNLITITPKTKPYYLLFGKSDKKKVSTYRLKFRVLSRYCYGKGKYYANQIIKKIENRTIDLQKDDCILIYSYWMHLLPIASITIKNYLIKNGYKNVVCVSRAHRVDLYNEVAEYKSVPFQRYFIENIDYIFPCSSHGEKYLQNLYPEYKNKIEVARLGTQTPNTSKDKKSCPVFLTCSRLSPVKRLDLFARAFSNLCTEHKDAIWICIGIGEEYDTICDILKSNNALENFKYLGYKTKEEIYDFYSKNDIGFFVNVSSSEGVPVSIMEAMSFKIPIIATDVGGTNEIVDSTNGFLIDESINEKELEKVLTSALSVDKLEYSNMSNKSYNKWSLLCSSDRNFDDWTAKLLSLFNEQN